MLIDLLIQSPAVRALADALGAGRRVAASGIAGSSTAFVAAAVARATGRHVVLILAHLDEVDEAADELAGEGVRAIRLPAMEATPGGAPSFEYISERLGAVRDVYDLGDGADPRVLICPIQGLMQSVPGRERLDALWRTLRRGDRVEMGGLVAWLTDAGYRRCDAAEEPGDFSVRGGIVDVFPAGGAVLVGEERIGAGGPVRIDLFGDEIDRIVEVDPETLGSGRMVAGVELVCADAERVRDEGGALNFLEIVPPSAVAILAETLEVTEQARGYYERLTDGRGVYGPPAVLKLLGGLRGVAEVNQYSAGSGAAEVRVELPVSPLPSFSPDAAEAVGELGLLADDHRVVVFCQTGGELRRFRELVAERAPGAAGRIEARERYLHRGFVWEQSAKRDARQRDSETATQGASRAAEAGPVSLPGCLAVSLSRFAFVPYHEMLHRFQARRRAVRLGAGRALDAFLDFREGDHVVHAEHGIARFVGLKVMRPPGGRGRGGEAEAQEYLTLEFAGRSRLHVPAMQIDQVQKYIGPMRGSPQLSTLGGQRWKRQKEQAAESVRDLAAEMLRVRAAREHTPGVRYPADTAWQKEFEAEFPYEETEDQLAAMAAIRRDMQSERPMDRLVCGDVGFGKTELAIRAVFKAVEFGKQAAVLVPTTVLAEQHERTFRSRLAGYPFRVESLSRFKSAGEAGRVLAALGKGQVDIIIGTHRLLSADVKFADLGLVVVDEEQRFGVEHKERLLRLRLTVDVLTLSATPIPRTLHMAMLGLRDISSLATPPLDRRAIVTEVIPYNERRLERAIGRELGREGQVYFVHNRVHNIRSIADDVRRMAPGARVVVGHGQMSGRELESVMLRFTRRQADILVSTTIIESGIDIPTANTMIINDADRFGLADLHQLRGRVGRYKHRAYCYMLLPRDRPVKEVAQKRLRAIEQYSMLGAGFKIAMRDLEIRGAGNLLGAEQSGHIAAVGYEMYCRLLDGAVKELRQERPVAPASATGIDIGVGGIIPATYIASEHRRMEAYRRIGVAASAAELARVSRELAEAYGEPPQSVGRLLELAEVRIGAAALGVRTIAVRGADVLLRTENPGPVASRFGDGPGQATVRVLPPPTGERLHEVYFRPAPSYLEPGTLLAVLRKRLAAAGE